MMFFMKIIQNNIVFKKSITAEHDKYKKTELLEHEAIVNKRWSFWKIH